MSAVAETPSPLAEVEARTRALFTSRHLSEPTRRVLQARFEQRFDEAPKALSREQMRTLEAVCLRLIPEPELVARVQLAAAMDARLAENAPRGWRYAEAAPDRELIAAGLDALSPAGAPAFADLNPADQDARLKAAQDQGGDFSDPRIARWFEELSSALVELFYAHPLVQVAIGYDGMADVGRAAVGFEAVAQEGPELVL